jgi:hypothetical protein
LLLEEYGVTFEYLTGKKNVVADALSHLDIDELNIQNEEALTLLSEAQISNIKFPMHTALIFREQTRVKKYGLLPPKVAESDPWVMICVDLVGPFTIKTPSKTHSLLALTMIDPATGWL